MPGQPRQKIFVLRARHFCSTFVLMVAELLPILSDAAPGTARRAEIGDRFRYWRGSSGSRYLFSVVPFAALADFRNAAVILAEPTADGDFLAWTGAFIDASGRLEALDDAWPTGAIPGVLAFVHFLAESEAELRALLNDLFPAPAQGEVEFKLAA
jgi:hypothetical protein